MRETINLDYRQIPTLAITQASFQVDSQDGAAVEEDIFLEEQVLRWIDFYNIIICQRIRLLPLEYTQLVCNLSPSWTVKLLLVNH